MTNVASSSQPSFDRRRLAFQAMQAAVSARSRAKLGQHSPICIYGMCEALGITVRFNQINMEGMYQRGTPPRIHLSALRPLVRRVYSCAHELGHHVFGHGSSIDELREDAAESHLDDPKEFLAEVFAGFVLMPTIGLRRAFSIRGWSPETVTATQVYLIACDFGVGYGTLLTHLSAGISMMPRRRATALQRVKPSAIRLELLGELAPHDLIVADLRRPSPTIDAEVNTLLLLPPGVETTGDALVYDRDLTSGRLFRAVRPGIIQARSTANGWAAFIRVARKAYVGLAQYRHLEDDPDE